VAVMYPKSLEHIEKATVGERKVFHFIQQAAVPHKDYRCWFEPMIGEVGKEPDFVLFGSKLGLVIIEVKDWTYHQIWSSDSHLFTLKIKDQEVDRTNPDRQAKQYVHELMEKLKTVSAFISKDPLHFGQLKIPIGRLVVFPNISRQDYLKKSLEGLIPLERVLLKDDLDPAGEILRDTSGTKFFERFKAVMLFPFSGFTPKEVEKLSGLIWPEIGIDLPDRQGVGKTAFQKEVQVLDEYQARFALRLGRGHRIIKGPPGSGKTLVLVHRCFFLRNYRSQATRILFVCYNIAFLSYLKRLVQEKGLGLGEGGVTVCHFYELCDRLLRDALGEPVDYDRPDSDYYQSIVDLSLEAVQHDQHPLAKFDVILVDEGQDFSNDMLQILLGLLRPGGDLVIALDTYQDLYRRKGSWQSVGIEARGRTHYLERVYRSTREIFEFTQKFLGPAPRHGAKFGLFPEDHHAPGGRPPEMACFTDLKDLETFLLGDIHRQLEQEEYKLSEIAVIYDDKIYSPESFVRGDRRLPHRLLELLEGAGIPTKWVSQDLRAKEMFDITTDRVSLISIHSAKGLDFDLVYLVGADALQPTEETRPKLTRLLYVALTRAKHRLVIPYVHETEFISRMKQCLAC
jgi:hypothetical protein